MADTIFVSLPHPLPSSVTLYKQSKPFKMLQKHEKHIEMI